MSKQQEDYKKLASDVLKKAERATGPYRDVLLGIADAYAALALHQGMFEDWARVYPVTPLRRSEAPPASMPRSEPPVQPAARSASTSATMSKPAVGRQANENGKLARPSAAA